jgi:hypothetical protein
MARVNFVTSDFRRRVAGAGALVQRNRYFEKNPFLSEDGAALIARPGMVPLAKLGAGPIRGMQSEAGSFNGDLFVASGDEIYRMTNQRAGTMIYAGLKSPPQGTVSMAATAQLGDTPEYLFIADGAGLYVYTGNGYAKNTLQGVPANGDVIRIGASYYTFTNGGTDVGAPDGTQANPWKVTLGLSSVQSFTWLAQAINDSGIPGSNYSTGVVENADVRAVSYTTNEMTVVARLNGGNGNNIVVSETGAGLNWSNPGFLVGGGLPSVTQVLMPDEIGAVDVVVISSYVIVIPAQIEGYRGRFYWIEPGEIVVDPFNYATAERSPDGLTGVEVFGDQFWLTGESTTEVWYPSGDLDTPMLRLQGAVLDRGSWESTATAMNETLILVDNNGGVFAMRGGSPELISTPDISEEIRRAIAASTSYIAP